MRYFSFFFFFSSRFHFLLLLFLFSFSFVSSLSFSLTSIFFFNDTTSWQHRKSHFSIDTLPLFILALQHVRKKFLEVALGRERRSLWHDNAIIWKDCLKSGTQENHDDFCETTTQSGNDLFSLKKRISAVKLCELSCCRILSRFDTRIEKWGWTLCGLFQELVIYCCLSDLLDYFSQSREEETYEYNFWKEVEEFRGTRQRTGAS